MPVMITFLFHDPSDPDRCLTRANLRSRIKIGMLQIRRWTDSPIAFGVAGNRLLFLAESELEKADEELLSAYVEQKQPVWGATVTEALSDNDPLGVSAVLIAHLRW